VDWLRGSVPGVAELLKHPPLQRVMERADRLAAEFQAAARAEGLIRA
jgi:pantoate kinase